MHAFFLVATLILAQAAAAQNIISGTVTDYRNQALAGVSISLKDSYDGGTSDSSGRFSFTTDATGQQVLQASAIGFKPVALKINISGTVQPLQLVLKEEITELKAVVISAGSFEASDRKKGTVLGSIDILTTASANADVTGALKTLPGAQQVGESEGLFVRGGTAAETKTFMDGTLVNNFFYSSVPNIAQRGRFSPWFLKGTVFSAGGYSALYGQALSSAVILETVDLPEQSSASLGVTVIGGSAGYQHLAKNKKFTSGGSYAYTNLWLAFQYLKQKQQFFTVPEYHTADANFRIKTSGTGIIKYYGYLSTNRLGFRTPSIDTPGYHDVFALSNFNTYHNVSYREQFGAGWKLNAGLSFTNNTDEISGALENTQQQKVQVQGLETKNFSLLNKAWYANARVMAEKKLAGLTALRFGSEYNFSREQPLYTLYTGQPIAQKVEENLHAVFAEADLYLTNAIAAKIGGRAEHSKLIDKTNMAPRISVAYKLGAQSQASLAYGIFYQIPETKYFPAAAPLHYMKATHYIAQYQKLGNDRTFRAEIFYKIYDDLLKTSWQNNREVAATNGGTGEASGFEIFWRDRRTIKNFDYWVSYSYLDTKRDFLNYPSALQPGFAAKHTASLVVKKFVGSLKTQFNGSYTYASGRPYYNIRYSSTTNKFSLQDQGITPDYHSMSISVNYLPNIFKQGAGKFTVLVFSVTNVLGSNQVFGYQYSYNSIRKEAIVPPSKRFVFLGAFISLGVDRTQDVINNNL